MELSPLERSVRDAAHLRDTQLHGEQATRRSRGIVHTPPELARGVATMVDARVRALGVGGISDPRVTLIDPACGPGAFVAAAIAVGGPATTAGAIAIDIDAGALGQLRTALQRDAPDVAVPELLEADTLRDPALLQRLSGLACPVIIGNPPWATAASRRLEQPMRGLLESYRLDAAGQPLRERKVGALSDTYVAFIRWASEVAQRAEGPAVVGLVTNSSFLEGPVHRGMRAALMRTFDGIDVIDLGGNAMLGRPVGAGRDDNVFGVRPGVAITLGWRAADARGRARLRHVRVRGTLEDKLRALSTGDIAQLGPTKLEPEGSACRFVPTPRVDARYAGWPALSDVMPFHREGVQTNRDAVVVATDGAALLSRLRSFVAGDARDELAAAMRPLAHYDPVAARNAVAEALEEDPDGERGLSVRPLAYRPFDDRVFCPVTPLCHRPRASLSRALSHSAFAIVTVRKDRGELPWQHAGVVHHDVDSSYLSARSSCRSRAFPVRDMGGADNIDSVYLERLAQCAGRALTAADAALYILGVLCSDGYRRAYDAPLRQDYPRIGWPASPHDFDAYREAGAALERAAGCPGAELPDGGDVNAELSQLRIGHLRPLEVAERRQERAAQHEGADAYRRARARARAWQGALRRTADLDPARSFAATR